MAQPEGDLALMEHAEHVLALMPEGTACVTMPRTSKLAPLENPVLASRTLADFVRSIASRRWRAAAIRVARNTRSV